MPGGHFKDKLQGGFSQQVHYSLTDMSKRFTYDFLSTDFRKPIF